MIKRIARTRVCCADALQLCNGFTIKREGEGGGGGYTGGTVENSSAIVLVRRTES